MTLLLVLLHALHLYQDQTWQKARQFIRMSNINQVVNDSWYFASVSGRQWLVGTCIWKSYTESKGGNCYSIPANCTRQTHGSCLATSDFPRDAKNPDFWVNGCEKNFLILKCWPLVQVKTNSMSQENLSRGNSLMVQWLGLGTSTAVAGVQPLVRNQDPHKLQGEARKKKKKCLQSNLAQGPNFYYLWLTQIPSTVSGSP